MYYACMYTAATDGTTQTYIDYTTQNKSTYHKCAKLQITIE